MGGRRAASRVADGRTAGERPASADADANRAARALTLETALYAPTKRCLEARGYIVKGEVCGCDMVAVRPGAAAVTTVVELKLGFTLDLVLQRVDRLAFTDAVWLAVAATAHGQIRDKRATGVRLANRFAARVVL